MKKPFMLSPLLALFCFGFPAQAAEAVRPAAQLRSLKVGASAAFIENRGQFDPQVKYQLRSSGATLWITQRGIVFDYLRPSDSKPAAVPPGSQPPGAKSGPPPPPEPAGRVAFSEEFVVALESPVITPGRPQPGIHNFFIGNDPSKWRTDVRSYGELVYRDVWPGIDLRLAISGSDIEREFIVRPGGDPGRVHAVYRGIDRLEVLDDGSLVAHTAFGDLRESKPLIYQEIGGERVAVNGKFLLACASEYTFHVEAYRPEYALVIDPTLLYSTFLGGTANDTGSGIAVDPSGNAYVTGQTQSLDFPATPGTLPGPATAAPWIFVTKLNPLGTAPVYSTYLGPDATYGGAALAVDQAGNAYLAGKAATGHPVTWNWATCNTYYSSWFLTKLNSAGNALQYSVCFGGAAPSTKFSIAVDPTGKAYVAGSSQGGLDTTANAFQTTNRGLDAFVAKIDTNVSSIAGMLYASYLGGEDNDRAKDIALDSSGNIYVTGNTYSLQFPVIPGCYQSSQKNPNPYACSCGNNCYMRCANAFVAKINP